MLRNLGDNPIALLLIVLLIVILFGASKLPNAARQMGRSARIFKSEIKEMKNDDGPRTDAAAKQGTEPLEGRVVDDHVHPSPAPTASPAPGSPAQGATEADRRDA